MLNQSVLSGVYQYMYVYVLVVKYSVQFVASQMELQVTHVTPVFHNLV